MQLPFRKLLPIGVAVAFAAAPVAVVASDSSGDSAAPNPALLRPELAGAPSAGEAMRDHVRDPLVREYVRLSRRHADLRGRPMPGAAARTAQNLDVGTLRARNRELRTGVEELDIPIPPVLKQVAECESHGNPRSVGGGGTFRGAFQFMQSTWEATGGTGDPIEASLEEQYRRAAILLARSGSSPWPVCGG